MSLVARVRPLGGHNAPIVLHDLSQVGFRGDCSARFDVPSLVAITLPPIGEVRARVRWTEDGVIAAEFIERLSDSMLQAILDAHPDSLLQTR